MTNAIRTQRTYDAMLGNFSSRLLCLQNDEKLMRDWAEANGSPALVEAVNEVNAALDRLRTVVQGMMAGRG